MDHHRNGVLKLLIARGEGLERRCGYRRVVDIGRHDRGIDGENQITIESIAIVNEDALVTNRLDSRSWHSERRLNVWDLAALAEVHLAAVSISFRRRESRRQHLRLNCLCRDHIEGKISASQRIAAGSHWNMDRRLGQLIHELWNGCGIEWKYAGDSGRLQSPVFHVHMPTVSVFVLALRRDNRGGP